jgi:hypothetical protein
MNMEKRRRIGSEKIDLSDYEVRQAEYTEEYDPNEDLSGGLSLEELEELGVISCPKPTKIINSEGYYKEWS